MSNLPKRKRGMGLEGFENNTNSDKRLWERMKALNPVQKGLDLTW